MASPTDPRARIASQKYDSKLSAIGKAKRLGDYYNCKTSILHYCLEHKEKHNARPSDLLQGQGLHCCRRAAIQKQANRRKELAAKKYDFKLAQFGKLVRLEPYQTAAKKILHRCIEQNTEGLITPNNALKGKGLSCCQEASWKEESRKRNDQRRETFDKQLAEFGKLKRLEEYVDSKTPILFQCLIHGEKHRIHPPGALSGRCLICCRQENIQKQADKRKALAASRYDKRLEAYGRIVRIDEYKGRNTKILHRCLAHGEEHLIDIANALRGDGLICCNRGTGWDTFERLLQGKQLKGANDVPTYFYIFKVPKTRKWVKVGIAINLDRRSKDPHSEGIYGELLGSWKFKTRRNALLIETAILRDNSLQKLSGQLDHLKEKRGFSEIRSVEVNEFLVYVRGLCESLEKDSINWAQWALDHIPELRNWEREALMSKEEIQE